MKIKEKQIKNDFGSIRNFLRSTPFSVNTYMALKNKKGDSFAGTKSKAFQLKELLRQKNYIIEENVA